MRLSCLAVALALSACTNPDDYLPLHGIVIPADGIERPAVQLLRQSHEIDPQSYYTPCDPSRGPLFKESQPDSEGRYEFELLRGETSSFTGFLEFCFRAQTTFGSGSTAWTDLPGLATGMPLAALREWRPALAIDAGLLQFEPIIPFPVEVPFVFNGTDEPQFTIALNHHATVTTGDGGLLWEADDRFVVLDGGANYREPLVLDAARLEDFEGALTLEAELDEGIRVPLGVSFTYVPAVLMRGLPLPLAGTAVPVSRGIPCAGFSLPCPITDGELTAVDAGFREELSLTLSSPTVLKTIVLRGANVALSGNYYAVLPTISALVTTEDGGTLTIDQPLAYPAAQWRQSYSRLPVVRPDGGYASVRTVFAAIPVDASAPVVSVKLLFPQGLVSITEVSLFE
ncbi:MAG: hypothetical protein Q8N23_34230 [Archangium sp.]|nr:hypothetical protein [Archangium sp.]MDP3157779.1 hypothetical protein [Archangium sp.]MDP3571259.1 hypothetical protein [Archangium sp.]